MNETRKRIRDALERWLERYREGPEPPERLHEQVDVFAIVHPNATAEEWSDFAKSIADSSYCDGFTRGFEWRERGMVERESSDPAFEADARRHEWRLSDDEVVAEMLATRADPNDPWSLLSPEDREILTEAIEQANAPEVADTEPPPADNEEESNDGL